MADFKTLKARQASLTSRLNALKGSTAVLRKQYEEAVEKLSVEFGVGVEGVDELLQKTTAKVVELEKEIKDKLDAFDGV